MREQMMKKNLLPNQPHQTNKKPYNTPRLVVYGNIRTLTQNAMIGNPGDSGPSLFMNTGQ
jgi:hypothetical protein